MCAKEICDACAGKRNNIVQVQIPSNFQSAWVKSSLFHNECFFFLSRNCSVKLVRFSVCAKLKTHEMFVWVQNSFEIKVNSTKNLISNIFLWKKIIKLKLAQIITDCMLELYLKNIFNIKSTLIMIISLLDFPLRLLFKLTIPTTFFLVNSDLKNGVII